MGQGQPVASLRVPMQLLCDLRVERGSGYALAGGCCMPILFVYLAPSPRSSGKGLFFFECTKQDPALPARAFKVFTREAVAAVRILYEVTPQHLVGPARYATLVAQRRHGL